MNFQDILMIVIVGTCVFFVEVVAFVCLVITFRKQRHNDEELDTDDFLQLLYDNEINFSIGCFWDRGVEYKLGDEINGYKGIGTFWDVKEGFRWFKRRIELCYPEIFREIPKV